MTVAIGNADVDRFRSAIERRLGILFDDSKLGYLAEVLGRRTGVEGAAVASYLDRLEGRGPWQTELRALAQELTVGETYFFRHNEQFRAFVEHAIPDRLAVRAGPPRLSVLSAGCASGEEAYSLAILLRERVPALAGDTFIRAVDISPASLEKAKNGRYSSWALRETPADLQRRWFRQEGREFTLDPTILAAVRFEERNLVQDDPELWPIGVYDIVFCRNVIMYFSPEHAQAVVARIARSLSPGGYLFLGHAETLRGLSRDFHLRHTCETFYYQRKDARAQGSSEDTGPPALLGTPNVSLVDTDWEPTWIETVQRSTDRIRTLAQTPRSSSDVDTGHSAHLAKPAVIEQRSRPELGIAFDLLREERFSAALDSMQGLSAELARDPEALLLRAVLLTHSGQLEAAAQVCDELLTLDDLNSGAHYLLALCAEGLGDGQRAADHDQVAIYLDPTFAMARLHVGILAQRAGQREAARRDLGHALSLLQREDASRLLLFGGGFSRDALVALCRAELARAGGKP